MTDATELTAVEETVEGVSTALVPGDAGGPPSSSPELASSIGITGEANVASARGVVAPAPLPSAPHPEKKKKSRPARSKSRLPAGAHAVASPAVCAPIPGAHACDEKRGDGGSGAPTAPVQVKREAIQRLRDAYQIDRVLFARQVLGRLKERQCGCFCDGDDDLVEQYVNGLRIFVKVPNGDARRVKTLRVEQETFRLPFCGLRPCGQTGCACCISPERDPCDCCLCCKGSAGFEWTLEFSKARDVVAIEAKAPANEVTVSYWFVENGRYQLDGIRIPAAQDPQAMRFAILAAAARANVAAPVAMQRE